MAKGGQQKTRRVLVHWSAQSRQQHDNAPIDRTHSITSSARVSWRIMRRPRGRLARGRALLRCATQLVHDGIAILGAASFSARSGPTKRPISAALSLFSRNTPTFAQVCTHAGIHVVAPVSDS